MAEMLRPAGMAETVGMAGRPSRNAEETEQVDWTATPMDWTPQMEVTEVMPRPVMEEMEGLAQTVAYLRRVLEEVEAMAETVDLQPPERAVMAATGGVVHSHAIHSAWETAATVVTEVIVVTPWGGTVGAGGKVEKVSLRGRGGLGDCEAHSPLLWAQASVVQVAVVLHRG